MGERLMAYLNLDLDFPNHPKVKRLVAILGDGAEILPVKLWCYCGKYHARDGRFAGYGDAEIEMLAGWHGEAGKMLVAMQKVGFMRKRGEIWEMHDWREHNGHIEALRERAKTAANTRWNRLKGTRESSNAPSSAQASSEQCSTDAPACTSRTSLYRPKRKRGVQKENEGGAAGQAPASRFPLPDFSPLPQPLFATTAGAMTRACDEQIVAIKKAAVKTDVKARTEDGTEFVARHELEPEAKRAIGQWTERKKQINKALAG